MTQAPRRIVITRPAGEAAALAAHVREAGGEPLLFPVIEIQDAPAPELAALDAVIARLDTFDLALFISPSAVDKAMTRIHAQRQSQSKSPWPARLRCAAIGPGGVRALQRFGITEVIAPDAADGRFDSEALLASPFMQAVRGQRVVLFRGNGGRELLAQTLTARGTIVEAVSCYQRAIPQQDATPLLQAWARGEVAAVIVTSSEGLRNLLHMTGAAGAAYLRDTPVVVPHPRIAAVARAQGCLQVLQSPPGDAALARTALLAITQDNSG